MAVTNLPKLPPMPKAKDDPAIAAIAATMDMRVIHESMVARVRDGGEVEFMCAGCGHIKEWWGGQAWGRWNTGQTRLVHVRKSTGRWVMFPVPVTVAGRVCHSCAHALPGWRRVQEPEVTVLK